MSALPEPVLVTGAGGFLGCALAEVLCERGIEHVCVVRPGGRSRLGAHVCDLGDPTALTTLLEAIRPAAILNAGAIVDFRPGVLHRHYAANVLAPGIMAAWAVNNGAFLAQASTCAVHGARTAKIGPETPILLDTDYGQGKYLAEKLVSASGCQAAILRIGGIYGAGGPAHLGLNRAIDGAMSGSHPTIIATGKARRNYIHARDVAQAFLHCVAERITGVHLCASTEILSMAEMLDLVAATFMDGAIAIRAEGDEADDQILTSSSALPPTLPMVDWLSWEKARRR